jgi:hypothetical protein
MVQTDAHPAVEVLENNASPAVKRVYDDIKPALRVPVVDLVFRELARYPDFLIVAWRQLQPNVQTVYFERQADAIRAEAAAGVAAWSAAPAPSDDAALATLGVFHYMNPKLLIAVAALRAAAGGQYPKLEELPPEEKRRIPDGVPDGAPSITLVDPDASGAASETLADVRAALGLHLVTDDFRALAQWPGYLQQAWSSLRPLVPTAEHRALQRRLRLMAESAILVLPFRVEINPHVMRLCGLSEGELDDIRSILDRYYRLLPGRIADIAWLSVAARGHDQARRSPFPI